MVISRIYSARGLHGAAVHEFGRRIFSGEFGPGKTLPKEQDLAELLGVSRTVAREVVKVLIAKGVVESRPKTGMRVLPRDHWNLLDVDLLAWQFDQEPSSEVLRKVHEVRCIVEPASARLSAIRATPEQIEDLRDAFRDMTANLEDVDRFTEADIRFHSVLFEAVGNEFVEQLATSIGAALKVNWRWFTRRHLAAQGGLADVLPPHSAVLEAVASRDPDAAELAVTQLLGAVEVDSL